MPATAFLLPIALANTVTHIITLDGAKHRSKTKFGRVRGGVGEVLSKTMQIGEPPPRGEVPPTNNSY